VSGIGRLGLLPRSDVRMLVSLPPVVVSLADPRPGHRSPASTHNSDLIISTRVYSDLHGATSRGSDYKSQCHVCIETHGACMPSSWATRSSPSDHPNAGRAPGGISQSCVTFHYKRRRLRCDAGTAMHAMQRPPAAAEPSDPSIGWALTTVHCVCVASRAEAARRPYGPCSSKSVLR
jgi:hypothetical protein